MPGGDRTGPMGAGPMTGRAAGFCTGNNMPGYANPAGGRMGMGFGRGFGRGGGRGMAWGRGGGFGRWGAAAGGYFPAAGYAPQGYQQNPEQEADFLKSQAKYLEDSLSEIKSRLSELEAKS
ncbi:MAG TPA: DUF5320 domain-containing protein [bacterium]|nr:DUF5320 domain-containing protein [bacterium]